MIETKNKQKLALNEAQRCRTGMFEFPRSRYPGGGESSTNVRMSQKGSRDQGVNRKSLCRLGCNSNDGCVKKRERREREREREREMC